MYKEIKGISIFVIDRKLNIGTLILMYKYNYNSLEASL